MSYKQSDANFAEFQSIEGFGKDSTKDTSKTQLPKGYEGYSQTLNEYPESQSLGETEASSDAFAGFEGLGNTTPSQYINDGKPGPVLDDAFAGYATDAGLSETQLANAPEGTYNAYGSLAGTPTESFYTFFHQASLANTDTDLIKFLASAVKAVPNNASTAVKKDYYNIAKAMLAKRQKTDMRHLDVQRAEIESNLGWLINPKLPKFGGFNGMLRAPRLGDSALAKEQRQMAFGKDLIRSLKASHPSSFRPFGDVSPVVTYVGLGLLGLVAAGVAYHFLKKSKTTVMKKRKRK